MGFVWWMVLSSLMLVRTCSPQPILARHWRVFLGRNTCQREAKKWIAVDGAGFYLETERIKSAGYILKTQSSMFYLCGERADSY